MQQSKSKVCASINARDIATIQTNSGAECAPYRFKEISFFVSFHFIFSVHEHQPWGIFRGVLDFSD